MQTTLSPNPSFDFDNFTFGVQATDRMLLARYGQSAWQDFQIVPFGEIKLSPLAMCFHYGQTVFEGMKAYRMVDGGINVFRMAKHHDRLNRSLRRMAMPEIPSELFLGGLIELIHQEEKWIIDNPDYSLYIRPFVIATEPRLGVDAAEEYLFMIILSPLKAYYSKNLKVKVETEYIRAAQGGAGSAKNGGNYGASMLPQRLAKKAGFDQILWLDAAERKYIEESGTMNLMFILDGKTLITPPTGDTILDGITRDSLLQLAPVQGLEIEESRVPVDELIGWIEAGIRVEAFGVGTAAVISPFEEISYLGKTYATYTGKDASMYGLKQELADIRRGISEDRFNWNNKI
jgi:branched-chain amino acid aminotransferase